MPSFRQALARRASTNARRIGVAGGGGSFRSALANRLGSRGGDDDSLESLREEASLLQQRNELIGAPPIEQDRPGFLGRTVDVLSGLNFAFAGAADELGQGNGIGAALSRAGRELLSSSRSLPFGRTLLNPANLALRAAGVEGNIDEFLAAEKEAFGEVLENAGFGTYTLADALPILEGTILGNLINTRGTVGLALDIASDPLTYFTFGVGSAVRRGLLPGVTKAFSRRGNKAFGRQLELVRRELDEGKSIFELGRDVLDNESAERLIKSVTRQSKFGDDFAVDAAEEARERVLKEVAFRRAVKEHGEEAILHQGGINWFGANLVKGKDLRAIYSKFGQPLVDATRRFKWGDAVLNGAETSYKKMRKTIVSIFHSHERLADLPENMQRAMISGARRFKRGQEQLEGRLRERLQQTILDDGAHLVKNPDRVEPVVRAIEKNAIEELPEADRAAAHELADFFEELGRDAVEMGMLTEEQFARRGSRYFAHMFDNNPEEFTEVWAQWQGKLATAGGKHNKERVYDTLDESVRVSGLLNEVTEAARRGGLAVPITPKLVPNYVLDDVLGKYVRWYTEQKARRLFAQEAADLFGTKVEQITGERITRLFEGLEPWTTRPEHIAKIAAQLDNPKTSPIKRKRLKTEEIVERPIQHDLHTGRPIRSREGVDQAIHPTQGDPIPRQFDRVEAERVSRGLSDEQRDNVRRVLTALDDAPAGKRKGFLPKNAAAGRALAAKLRIGRGLDADEWVEALKIAKEQKARALSAINRGRVGADRVKSLDLGPGRRVSGAEAVGGVVRREADIVDADVLDIEKSIRAGVDTEVNAKSVLNPLSDAERNFIKGLGDQAVRKEYFRQILMEMDSASQVVDFMGKYGDEFLDDLPRLRMNLEGHTEDALKSFGESASEYVLRGANSMWGKDVKFVPRLIARYIDEADPKIFKTKEWAALDSGLSKIDFINNWLKIGVYPLFPASGVRDHYSNLWFNSFRIGFHALNPRLYAQSIKVLAHMSDAPATIRAMSKVMTGLGFDPNVITTRSGRKIPVEQAARQLRLRNITISGEQQIEVITTAREGTRYFVKKKGEKGIGPNIKGGVGKVVHEVREPLDNISRVALGVQNLIDDLDYDDIGHEVGQFLFHYNEIPAFSREVLTRVIPFGRFILKNTEFHYNMLRRNPGAVINRIKPFRGRESERQEMTRFKADALQMRLERDGRTLTAVTGVDLPTRNLDFYFRGSLPRTIRMIGASMSPVIKVPTEIATGVDLFTGSDNPRVRSDLIGRFLDKTNAPKGLKDWVGYVKKVDEAGRASYTVDRHGAFSIFIRGWMFSRIVSTSDRQFREFQKDQSFAARALDVLSGLRLESINLDDEQRRRLNRRLRQLHQSAARRGAEQRFETTFVPKAPRGGSRTLE